MAAVAMAAVSSTARGTPSAGSCSSTCWILFICLMVTGFVRVLSLIRGRPDPCRASVRVVASPYPRPVVLGVGLG